MTPGVYQKSVLPSGITLVSETIPHRRSIALGVWVRNGARDEPAELLGVSHFIEHMMFKGTERRDARAIAQSLESLGGHLDAFTAREQVCYYARALSEHLVDVVDVISDITCHSRFADQEVGREKSVVREEIFASEDNPEDKVNELLSAQTWGGHALGRPILGTVDTIDSLSSNVLRKYFRSRYRPEHLVVAATGALDHEPVRELIASRFAAPDGEALPLSGPPPAFRPSIHHELRSDLQQLYLSLATRGTSYSDTERYPLIVLNTLLGGGMSSRLFQSVREEAGLAYSVFSATDFHRDSGMISVHLGVSPGRAREALARVREELLKLRDNGPGEEEVVAARSQLKGNVLMGQESVSNRMYYLAHEELYCQRYTPPDEQTARIEAVTSEQVALVARRYLSPERFVLTALGPAPDGPLSASDWPIDALQDETGAQ
jgi:predicted Zn-dependent peptidase